MPRFNACRRRPLHVHCWLWARFPQRAALKYVAACTCLYLLLPENTCAGWQVCACTYVHRHLLAKTEHAYGMPVTDARPLPP